MHELLFVGPFAYAAADRLWGADKPAFKGKKAAIALLLIGGGALAGGIPAVLFGVTWLIWRSVPFFNGSGAPQTSSERLAAVLRHAPVVGAAALIAYWRGLAEPQTALAFAGFAAGAIGLAVAYGQSVIRHREAGERIGNLNTRIELLRGGLYGLAVLLTLLAPQSIA